MSDQIMRRNGGKSSNLSSTVRRFAGICGGFAAIPNSGNQSGESGSESAARGSVDREASMGSGESVGRTHDKEDTTRGRAPAHGTGTCSDARGPRTRSPAFARGARRDRGAGRRRHGGFRLVRYETGTVPERPSGAREPPGRGTVPTGWGPPPTPAPPPGPRSPAERGPRDLSALGGRVGPPDGADGERPSAHPGFGLAGRERWGCIAVLWGVSDGDQTQQGHPLERSRQGGRVPPARASSHPLGQGRGRTRGGRRDGCIRCGGGAGGRGGGGQVGGGGGSGS